VGSVRFRLGGARCKGDGQVKMNTTHVDHGYPRDETRNRKMRKYQTRRNRPSREMQYGCQNSERRGERFQARGLSETWKRPAPTGKTVNPVLDILLRARTKNTGKTSPPSRKDIRRYRLRTRLSPFWVCQPPQKEIRGQRTLDGGKILSTNTEV